MLGGLFPIQISDVGGHAGVSGCYAGWDPLAVGGDGAGRMGILWHRKNCTKMVSIIWNVKKKYLTSDGGYAIIPQVQGKCLDT